MADRSSLATPQAMEADEYDHDSTFGGDRESLASSSTSLNSEVTRYQYENGRRYHGYRAGQYLFPNDEEELNRMDIEHQNQKLQMDGKLHLCPLDNPKQILDVGTGTGIWAMEMADENPECEVMGLDLSPVQPVWVPQNCEFIVDDFLQEWTYGDERFDMIHCRFLIGSVDSFPDLYKRVYNALRPGGWLEVVEMEPGTFSDDGSVSKDAASVRWWTLLNEAFTKQGRRFPDADEYPKMLKSAGFVNIQHKLMKRPTNDWPKDPKMKEIGKFTCLNFLEGLSGFSLAPFTRTLGWTVEEVQVLNAQVRKETVTRKIHGWQKGVVCYGQRPSSGDDTR